MNKEEVKLVKCPDCTRAFYQKSDEDREYCPFCGNKVEFEEAKLKIE